MCGEVEITSDCEATMTDASFTWKLKNCLNKLHNYDAKSLYICTCVYI